MNPPKTTPPSMLTPREADEPRRATSDAVADISKPQSERELRKAEALRFLLRTGGEAPRAGDERD